MALGLGSPPRLSLEESASLDSFGLDDSLQPPQTPSQDTVTTPESTADAESGPVNGRPVLGALLAAVGEPSQDAGTDDELYGSAGHWQRNMDPNVLNAYSALQGGTDSQDTNVADRTVLHAMDLLHDIRSSEKEVEEAKAKADSSTLTQSSDADSALVASSSNTLTSAAVSSIAPSAPREQLVQTSDSEQSDANIGKASASGLGVTPIEVIPLDDSAPISNIMNWTDQADKFWSQRNATNTKLASNRSSKAPSSHQKASLVETGQRQMYLHLLRKHATAEQIAAVEDAKHAMFLRYQQRLQELKNPPTPKPQGNFGGDSSGESMLLSAAQLREKSYELGLDGELQYWNSQVPEAVISTTAAPMHMPVYRGNALLDLYHSSLERRGAKPFAEGSEEMLDAYRHRIAQIKAEENFASVPKQQIPATPPSPTKRRGTVLLRIGEDSRYRDADMSRVARHLHRGELAARAVKTRGSEIWEKYRHGLEMMQPPPTIPPPSWRKREDLSIHLSARWQPTMPPTAPPKPTTPAPSLLAQYREKLKANNIDPYADADTPIMQRYRTELAANTERANLEAEAELTQEQAELLKQMVSEKARSEAATKGMSLVQQGDPAFMAHARKVVMQARKETAMHNRKASLIIQRGRAALQVYNAGLRDHKIGKGSDLEGADLSSDLLQADGLLEESRREIAKNLRQIKQLNGAHGVPQLPQSMLVALEQYRHNHLK